jgi:hypothetical protein
MVFSEDMSGVIQEHSVRLGDSSILCHIRLLTTTSISYNKKEKLHCNCSALIGITKGNFRPLRESIHTHKLESITV